MRSRTERKQDFEQMKDDLFEAGVSVLKAAKAQEEMFHTSLEALAEAYEGAEGDLPALPTSEAPATTAPLIALLQAQQQAAIAASNVEAYLEATEKLKRLKELEVETIELDARRLEAQIRIALAQEQLAKNSDASSFNSSPSDSIEEHKPASDRPEWTEEALKKKYKTLKAVQQAFGIKAKTWALAIDRINA